MIRSTSSVSARRWLWPVLAIIVLAALAGAFWLGKSQRPAPSQPAAATPAAPGAVAVTDGLTTVAVSVAVQRESGIRVAPLAGEHREATSAAFGTVLDPAPLFELRGRLAVARGESAAAVAAATAAQADFERNRLLYDDDRNVSLRALDTARAASLAAQARVAAARATQRSLEAGARAAFGDVLGRWLADPAAPALAGLRDGREALVRVTVPDDFDEAAPATARIETAARADAAASTAATGDGATAAAGAHAGIAATLLSASPRGDPAVQGRAYLYRAAAPLPSGEHVAVRLMRDADAAGGAHGTSPTGVMVPADAIVWYGGQPWAYVQADGTHFQRRRVEQTAPVNGGFFVTEGFAPGQRVVVGGAQLLLSEESRAQLSAAGAGDDD